MIGILGLATLQPWVPGPPNTIKIIRIKNTFKPFQGENGWELEPHVSVRVHGAGSALLRYKYCSNRNIKSFRYH